MHTEFLGKKSATWIAAEEMEGNIKTNFRETVCKYQSCKELAQDHVQ
jgi:hypothetical protein